MIRDRETKQEGELEIPQNLRRNPTPIEKCIEGVIEFFQRNRWGNQYLDIEMQFSNEMFYPAGGCDWDTGPNGLRGWPLRAGRAGRDGSSAHTRPRRWRRRGRRRARRIYSSAVSRGTRRRDACSGATHETVMPLAAARAAGMITHLTSTGDNH